MNLLPLSLVFRELFDLLSYGYLKKSNLFDRPLKPFHATNRKLPYPIVYVRDRGLLMSTYFYHLKTTYMSTCKPMAFQHNHHPCFYFISLLNCANYTKLHSANSYNCTGQNVLIAKPTRPLLSTVTGAIETKMEY